MAGSFSAVPTTRRPGYGILRRGRRCRNSKVIAGGFGPRSFRRMLVESSRQGRTERRSFGRRRRLSALGLRLSARHLLLPTADSRQPTAQYIPSSPRLAATTVLFTALAFHPMESWL